MSKKRYFSRILYKNCASFCLSLSLSLSLFKTNRTEGRAAETTLGCKGDAREAVLVLASTSSSSVSKKERATKLAGSDFQTTTLRLFPRKIRIARRRGKDNDGRPKPNARGRARRARVSRPRAQTMGTDGCRGTTRAPPLYFTSRRCRCVSRSVLDFGFLYRSETFGETSVFLRKTRRSERQRKENVARRQKDISRRRTESRVFFSLHDVLN